MNVRPWPVVRRLGRCSRSEGTDPGRQRGDPAPGRARGGRPGHPIGRADGRAAALVPVAAGRAAVLGDAGRAGRHLRLRDLGRRRRTPSSGSPTRSSAPRRATWSVRCRCAAPSNSSGSPSRWRRSTCPRWPPTPAETDRAARLAAALQPRDRVRRRRGVRGRGRDPRRLGRPGGGGGRRRHRPRRGRADPCPPGRRRWTGIRPAATLVVVGRDTGRRPGRRRRRGRPSGRPPHRPARRMAGVHGDRCWWSSLAGGEPRLRGPDALFGDGPGGARGPVGAGLPARRCRRPTPWPGYRVAGAPGRGAPARSTPTTCSPERVLAGDRRAAERCCAPTVYAPLAARPRPAADHAGRLSGRTAAAWNRPPGRLFVHPNTVRYRLRRIAEITGRDPWDPRDLLALHGRADPRPARPAELPTDNPGA